MSDDLIGFIGLGNMGRGMAANVAAKGHAMIVHDLAGTADRAPEGAVIAQSNAEVARRSRVVAISLPSVAANKAVIEEIAEVGRAGQIVLDTNTIGVAAARENAARLAEVGIRYVDSPVSGLAVRAREGTLASMAAGAVEDFEAVRPVIEGYSRVVFHVGTEPGLGQRMKLVNNAMCISQYVITSEALAYGENGGLGVDAMLEVINESSGMNFATSFIFPLYVATGRYDESGAEAHVPCKDIGLYIDGAAEEGTPKAAIEAAYEIFRAFTDENPKQDQMRIYPFVKGLEG